MAGRRRVAARSTGARRSNGHQGRVLHRPPRSGIWAPPKTTGTIFLEHDLKDRTPIGADHGIVRDWTPVRDGDLPLARQWCVDGHVDRRVCGDRATGLDGRRDGKAGRVGNGNHMPLARVVCYPNRDRNRTVRDGFAEQGTCGDERRQGAAKDDRPRHAAIMVRPSTGRATAGPGSTGLIDALGVGSGPVPPHQMPAHCAA